MSHTRLRPRGSGARLRRDRSMRADAQRRFNAAVREDETVKAAPTPDPSPQRVARAGRGERALLGEINEAQGGSALTPLTHEARALYEGGVVPVRALARLCGVSLRTLYYHVNARGWRRRRSAVPRDPAKSERQRRRYQESKASRPAAPRGLKARDPEGQAKGLSAAERAGALAGAALAKAIARQDAEAQARMLALLTRALRDLAIAKGLVEPRRLVKAKQPTKRKPRSRPYEWRPAGTPPVWAERER